MTHIHVERNVTHPNAVIRNAIASAFGLATESPETVTTGCGVRVPYAMTSQRPESVTCLACREHAVGQHLRLAETIRLSIGLPGVGVDQTRAGLEEMRRHQDLARRYSRTDP